MILDALHSSDPNIFIVDSYKVIGYRKKKKLISIMIEYANHKDTLWNRSEYSMMVEFYMHNIAYRILSPFKGLNKNIDKIIRRAKDTDFTLSDEYKYKTESIRDFVKNMLVILAE